MNNISQTLREAIRWNAIACEPASRNEDGTFTICIKDILTKQDMDRITRYLSTLKAFGPLEIIDDPENPWIVKVKVA